MAWKCVGFVWATPLTAFDSGSGRSSFILGLSKGFTTSQQLAFQRARGDCG
jgi:hypothetical protein